MYNKKLTLILIVVILLIVSCTSEDNKRSKAWNLVMKDGLLYKDSLATEPFTGHYKGKVMGKSIEYEVVDGKRTGFFVLYNEHNSLEVYGYQKENKNYGEWKYYYPDGSIESIGIFVDDQPDSVWNWFYTNGNLMQEGKFNRGMRNGDWKLYDELGNLIVIMKYENDIVIDSIKYELPGSDVKISGDSIYKHSD